MNKKMIVSSIAGVCFSVGALYLAFKNIPLRDLSTYLKSINYRWMIPSVALILFAFVLRVIRWQTIISASHRLSFKEVFHPLMIGYMLNCVLPARLGELARPAILKKKYKIPFTTGIATVAAERLFDMVCLVAFLAIIFATVPIDPDFSYTYKTYSLNRETLKILGFSMLMFSLLLVIGIAIITIDISRDFIIKTLKRVPYFFSFTGQSLPRVIKRFFIDPIEFLIMNIASGFSLVKNPFNLILCVLLSFVIYGLHGLSFYLFSLGCPGVDLNFLIASAVMIIICFIIALPSVPGYWGVWEAGGIFAMALFGISGKEAAGYTLANHAVQIIPIIIVGIVSALLTSVNIFQLSGEAKTSDSYAKESIGKSL